MRYNSLVTGEFDYFSGWGLAASGVVQATTGGDLLTYQLMPGACVAGYMVGYSGLGPDGIRNFDRGPPPHPPTEATWDTSTSGRPGGGPLRTQQGAAGRGPSLQTQASGVAGCWKLNTEAAATPPSTGATQ